MAEKSLAPAAIDAIRVTFNRWLVDEIKKQSTAHLGYLSQRKVEWPDLTMEDVLGALAEDVAEKVMDAEMHIQVEAASSGLSFTLSQRFPSDGNSPTSVSQQISLADMLKEAIEWGDGVPSRDDMHAAVDVAYDEVEAEIAPHA